MTPFSIFLSFLFHCVSADEHQWAAWDSEPHFDVPVLHTAFVQTGQELDYFSESDRKEIDKRLEADAVREGFARDERVFVVRLSEGDEDFPLFFDPPHAQFQNGAIGVPSRLRVFIRNNSPQIVRFHSIVASGSSDFHTSFVDVKEVGIRGVASMDIAFLPRDEGRSSAQFRIRTSTGIFHYEVVGTTVSNPFRLATQVGTRLPINASITRQLTVHNPFDRTFNIEEITTSGGNGHVDLLHEVDPTLSSEIPQTWSLRAFETKTIGTTRIIGHSLDNSTTFLSVSGRLLNDDGSPGERKSLMLPYQLQVVKSKGVFTTLDVLDFKMLRYGERSEALLFSVYQDGIGGRLEFESIYVEKGDASGIYMEFASNPPVLVLPGPGRNGASGVGKPADLVKVYFDASRVFLDRRTANIKKFQGRIIAVSRGGNYNVTIPFRASVYHGSVSSVGNDLCISDDLKAPHRRSVRLRNDLPFAVAIWNVSLSAEAQNYFTLRLFERTVTLDVGEQAPVFLLKYNRRVAPSFGAAFVFVQTNVSSYRVPINKFTGRLEVTLSCVDQEKFDFGIIERNDTRSIRFVLANNNEATITLRAFKSPLPHFYRLYHIGSIKSSQKLNTLSPATQEWNDGADLDLLPSMSHVFQLTLRAPNSGPTEGSESLVITSDFESKVYPVTFKIASGTLISIPESMNFGSTFAGRVVYRPLQVFNSFEKDMTLTRVSTLSRDSRFFFESFDSQNAPVIRSGRLTNLGRVMFMPEAGCAPSDSCYLGLPLHQQSTDGQWFVHGLTLPANLAEVDSYLYKKQRGRFDQLVASGKHRINETIVVDTDQVKNIQIQSTAELTWPRLLTRSSIHFPLTALGNFTIVNLTLANPTSVPIAIQVIPLVIYPDADALVDLFKEHLITPLTSQVEMNETLMFSLRDTELFTLKPDCPVPKLREELEAAISQSVPRFTLSMLLKPHMKVRLRLGFLPSDYTLRSSLLVIRNNLTVIEPVVVYGRGARIGMRVEDVEARSKKPLLFEIRHDHLSDCNNPKRLLHKLTSTLTVRRPFIVTNTGEVQFTVTNLSISGVPCENRGFRILNCYPFRLQPNDSYALDVAYTPDFLSATNEADLQLYMHMNGSSWLFHLAATVPPDMLSRCHRALPRPPFENLMYYSCVTALVFCLVCVLACAYLEGDRAVVCAIKQQHLAPRTLFDLNSSETLRTNTSTNVDNREWSTSADLKAGEGATYIRQLFFQLANIVVRVVRSVWIHLRRKPEQPRNPPKKKKKSPSMLAAKAKEKEAEREKEAIAVAKEKEQKRIEELHLNNENKVPQHKKRVQPVAPLNATNEAKNKQNGSNIRTTKKESDEADLERRLARSEKLMDEAIETVQRTRPTEKKKEEEKKKREPKKPNKPAANVNGVRRTEPPTVTAPQAPPPPREPSAARAVPVREVTPSVVVPPAQPTFELYAARSFSPASSRPLTPTPSFASSLDNVEYGLDDQRTPNESDGEVPDWMDEVVVAGNADDDFSAMASATEMVDNFASETWNRGTNEQNETNNALLFTQPTDIERKSSGGAIGSERKTKTLIDELQAERKTLLDKFNEEKRNEQSLGDWPMPSLKLDALLAADGSPQKAGWPSTSETTLPRMWPASPTTSQLDPMSLGMSLGTSFTQQPQFGLFTGADFGLWSTADNSADLNSWSNVDKLLKEDSDEEQ